MSKKGIRATPSGGPDVEMGYFGRKMIVWGTFSRSFVPLSFLSSSPRDPTIDLVTHLSHPPLRRTWHLPAMEEYARLVLAAPEDGHPQFHVAVRQLLAHHPTSPDLMDSFINIAHQRMPSSDARAAYHWRMLYIDASILKALARASMPGLQGDIARECIATLDHAIIVAGAAADDARRDYVVHDVIKQLQAAIPCCPPSRAIFIAKRKSAPVPHPLSTSTNSIPTLTALPSIVTAPKHWSRAPFVIRGYADDWPAMHQPHQWASLSYLFSVAGPGRIVPVEVGDDYRSDDWSQKLISWEEFLSSLEPSASAASVHRQHHTIYLAQHSLLAQFPQLRQDIITPDIVYACLASPDFPAYAPPSDVIVNAWLGPKGTISPAHTVSSFVLCRSPKQSPSSCL